MSQTNGQDIKDLIIFKVQISQASSDNKRHVLIYDKAKKNQYQQLLTSELKKFIGDAPKSFFYGIVEDKKIKLIKEAPWQTW